MRKIVRKIDLRDGNVFCCWVFCFFFTGCMLVDKSLLILVVDDTKKLANTGNKSGKLQR